MLIKVKDDSNLVRDSKTNAILNNNIDALTIHRNIRKNVKDKENIILDLSTRLEKIEKMIGLK